MKISILGTGNGACATAAEWALCGHDVSMFDFEQYGETLDAINAQGGIKVSGNIRGFGRISYAGTDVEKAIGGAEVILAIGPACSNELFADAVKNVIQKDQFYILSPGSNGGALITKRIFQECENARDVVLAETATLPYACRITRKGTVCIYHKLAGGLFLAAIPNDKTQEVLSVYRQVYPFAVAAENIFRTILQNANPILHPVITLMNAALIERTQGDFYFYEEGVTPAIGRMIQAVDRERIEIGRALELDIMADPEISVLQGYLTKADYFYGYSTAPGFQGIRAQDSLRHRYLDEDVGYGLVFLSELGKMVGVKTQMMDAVILLASVLTGKDYRKQAARTLENIGFTIDEVRKL
jgi:opine dehydrogenase